MPPCQRPGRISEGALHLFERYSDAAALQAHREADYDLAYRAALGDLLASPVEVAVLSEVDVAWADVDDFSDEGLAGRRSRCCEPTCEAIDKIEGCPSGPASGSPAQFCSDEIVE